MRVDYARCPSDSIEGLGGLHTRHIPGTPRPWPLRPSVGLENREQSRDHDQIVIRFVIPASLNNATGPAQCQMGIGSAPSPARSTAGTR